MVPVNYFTIPRKAQLKREDRAEGVQSTHIVTIDLFPLRNLPASGWIMAGWWMT